MCGSPRQQLHDFLCTAFTTASLQRFVHLQLADGDQLKREVAWGDPLNSVVYNFIQVLERHGHLNNLFFDALRSTFPNRDEIDAIAELWSRSQAPDRLITRYLEWVRNEYDSVWVFHGSTPSCSLTSIYVQMRSRALEPATAVSQRMEEQAHCSFVELLDAAPMGRWTLQGNPGSGKSTLLRHFAIERAQDTQQAICNGDAPPPGGVPLLISLPELAENGPPYSFLNIVVANVLSNEQYDDVDGDTLRRRLSSLGREGKLVLLLDGLDEVAPSHRDNLIEVLGRIEQHLKSPIILASRFFGYERPNVNFEELRLLPLNRQCQHELLMNWGLQPAVIDAVLEQVETCPPMQDMAGNPFLLTLLAFLAIEHSRENNLAPLPRRRATLYREVLARFIRGCARHPSQLRRRLLMDVDELHTNLRELALLLLQRNSGPWTTDELEQQMEHLPSFRCEMMSTNELVEDIASDTGLLEPTNRNRTTWKFRHRSFLECLAAEALHAGGTERIYNFAGELGGPVLLRPRTWFRHEQLGRWAEVFALLAGLGREKPVEFLQHLRRVNEKLALRALTCVEDLPPKALLNELNLSSNLALVRELMSRIEEYDILATRLVALARRTHDQNILVYLAAALLAIGAEFELSVVCDRAGGANELGIAQQPWCRIPHGKFMMGSADDEDGRDPSEGPRHEVTLTSGFDMLATPVTQALYAVVTGTNPSQFSDDPRRPVESVNWKEAEAFCRAWSKIQRREIALPTDAEWEYACRAGSEHRYFFGDDDTLLEDYAWLISNADSPERVTQKLPNPWGLYDILGNVSEFCRDDRRTYHAQPATDPVGSTELIAKHSKRVIRGGSVWLGRSSARPAARPTMEVGNSNGHTGFRCVRRLPETTNS